MRWLREPIVHFLVAGVGLFVLDLAVSEPAPSAPEDPGQTITITPPMVEELRTTLRAELQREPTSDEIEAQVDRWITDEALRREAIRLGLDDNDPIIRRRLVQNMRFVLEAAEPPPEPSDADVDAWLAENLPDPAVRARVDFVHVFVDSARHDDPGAVAAALRQPLAGGADPTILGDPFIRGRTFRNVGRSEIERTLGGDAAEAILGLEPGTWSPPIESPYGLHLVRVDARHVPPLDGTQAERDAARRALAREATRAAEEASIEAVVSRYRVVREDVAGSGAGE